MTPTMPAWLKSLCRRILAMAPAANVNPAPPGPPPAVQKRFQLNEPDLEFIGTRDLFTEIASRYDACVIVCVRNTGRNDGSCSVVFMTQGVEQPAGFLHVAASLVKDDQIRDIGEGDL